MRGVLLSLVSLLIFSNCSDHPKQSKFSDYYENGKKKSEGEISEDGARVGCWKYYHESGFPMASGCYVEGLKKGKWVYYDTSNKVRDSIEWSIYEGKDSAYKINYPSKWKLVQSDKTPNALGVFNYSKGKPFYDNFNVTQQTYSSGFDLAKEMESMLNTSGDSLEIFNSVKAEINGKESVLVSFSITREGTKLKILQGGIKSGSTLYLITCFSDERDFSKLQELFKEVVFSFNPK